MRHSLYIVLTVSVQLGHNPLEAVHLYIWIDITDCFLFLIKFSVGISRIHSVKHNYFIIAEATRLWFLVGEPWSQSWVTSGEMMAPDLFYLRVYLVLPFHHYSSLFCHCPVGFVTALIGWHSITSSVFMSEAWSLSWYLAGYRVRKLVSGWCIKHYVEDLNHFLFADFDRRYNCFWARAQEGIWGCMEVKFHAFWTSVPIWIE
jgi:hypothetical protein